MSPEKMNQQEYEWMVGEMRRLEIECGCELPPIEDDTLAARAERLLRCDPTLSRVDRDLCLEIVNRRIGYN